MCVCVCVCLYSLFVLRSFFPSPSHPLSYLLFHKVPECAMHPSWLPHRDSHVLILSQAYTTHTCVCVSVCVCVCVCVCLMSVSQGTVGLQSERAKGESFLLLSCCIVVSFYTSILLNEIVYSNLCVWVFINALMAGNTDFTALMFGL